MCVGSEIKYFSKYYDIYEIKYMFFIKQNESAFERK